MGWHGEESKAKYRRLTWADTQYLWHTKAGIELGEVWKCRHALRIWATFREIFLLVVTKRPIGALVTPIPHRLRDSRQLFILVLWKRRRHFLELAPANKKARGTIPPIRCPIGAARLKSIVHSYYYTRLPKRKAGLGAKNRYKKPRTILPRYRDCTDGDGLWARAGEKFIKRTPTPRLHSWAFSFVLRTHAAHM